MDRFMKAFDGITFETFVVAWLVGFGACVAPAATLFLTVGHVRHLDKVDAAVLFVLGLAIDMVFRHGYGRETVVNLFKSLIRPGATKPESERKTDAAKVAVELGKRKQEVAEPKTSAVPPGEVHAVASADKPKD